MARVAISKCLGSWACTLAAALCSQSDAAEIICGERFEAIVEGHALPIAYCTTHDIDQANAYFTRLIVVVHPSGEESFATVQKMASAAAVAGEAERTLIVSPQFPSLADLMEQGLEEDVLAWGSLWRGGYQNASGSPPIWPAQVSSYAVIDQMIEHICTSGRFSNISSVVVTGMSAGGQVVDRYAKVSHLEEDVLDSRGIDVHYVAFAPSSFAYLDGRRAVDGTDEFEVPDASGCSNYDRWKYGLSNVYSILPFTSRADTIARFESRNVVYACGTADNDPAHVSLDVTCAAMFQGAHRLERTVTHHTHLLDIYGESAACNKLLVLIPDIAHSELGLFGADEIRRFLFGAFGNDAVDDHVLTDFGQAVSVFPLSNDTNAICDSITLNSWDSTSAQGGTITQCGGTCLSYTPPSGFTGQDTFGYSIETDAGDVSSALVRIDVLSAPVIQPMIDAASNGEILVIPSGTYYEAIDFMGKAIELRSENGAADTIIDNLGRGTVVDMNSGEQGSSILDGFTIRGGHADQGGGMHVQYASPTIRNCVFSNNRARRGAGIRLLGSNAHITNCTFETNIAWDDGGGMRVSGGGSPLLESCTFVENTALDDGGGFAAWSTSPTLQDCVFEENRCGDRGGAVRLGETEILLSHCAMLENRAGREGAGVYGYSSSSGTMTNCLLQQNVAELGGGLFCEDDGTLLMVEYTTFCGNQSTQIEGPWSEGAQVDLIESCPSDCPSDLTGDGEVNGADLGLLFVMWGSCSDKSCPADLTGDGQVNGADLGLMFVAWGLCPN